MKINWFNAGWFPVEYTLITKEKQWNKLMDNLGVKMDYPSTAGSATSFSNSTVGHTLVVVTLSKEKFKASNPVHENQIEATLVHECTHALDLILDSIGEDNIGSELKAYGTEAIFRDLKQDAIRQGMIKQ